MLAERASAWRAWRDQAQYVNALERQMTALADGERTAVAEWVDWSRQHLALTNPMHGTHAMPVIPAATREFLTPHIRNWHGPLRDFEA